MTFSSRCPIARWLLCCVLLGLRQGSVRLEEILFIFYECNILYIYCILYPRQQLSYSLIFTGCEIHCFLSINRFEINLKSFFIDSLCASFNFIMMCKGRLNFMISLSPGKFFIKTFFFLFYKENTSPGSEKKNFILKNLRGDCNIIIIIIIIIIVIIIIIIFISCHLYRFRTLKQESKITNHNTGSTTQ
jgi:hypothetical protein